MPIFPIPIGDDVIIRPFEYSAKIGSLYAPDQAKRRVNQGIVIAKGPLVSDDIDTADHVFLDPRDHDPLGDIESSLLDRIDTISIAEGWEF